MKKQINLNIYLITFSILLTGALAAKGINHLQTAKCPQANGKTQSASITLQPVVMDADYAVPKQIASIGNYGGD